MKEWDLSGGAARLDQAVRMLQKTKGDVMNAWDDENYRNVEENYVTPVEGRVKRALDAIRHLAEVLTTAHRECDAP